MLNDPSIYLCMAFPLVAVAGGLIWTWWRVRNARRLWRSIRRRSQLRCEQCGYDVRAGHDRCPECGHSLP